ncbi:hypothetical protein [Mycolicibacterium baixiangningiae]|uniref:hypothetical protein n=1 Tax=Mycolicibacterium baixiangningiae TaxID=2761578 RepID=UPI00299F72AF|nr:hypothetical protein [Mycolicibacterium baixiangningiae]
MTAHPTFTPSAMNAEELDSLTVGRDGLLDTLVNRIRGAVRDGSRPHTLLIAPRGGGKTHTLHVAVHRSLADHEIARQVLPALIPEDALAIGSYADLLVEIARTVDDRLGDTARALRRHKDTVGIEEAILAAAAGRMILLAVENLDRVFDALGESGQGSLRAWVETSTAITIFGTAPMLFSGVSSRSYPWYGSFMVESLPEFTVAEGAVMLSRAARRRGDTELAAFIESPKGLERLQVIHRLAGGSPRLWHILSDCVDPQSLDALVPAVEALLDRLAPYYQQRLWQLPPGEQRLVVELARSWEPRIVSDLAAAVGISNQSAATALGRLTSSRWVTAAKARTGDQRASWYDLTEPLLRYQLQFRENRGQPLRLIVEFLRAFYAQDRLRSELATATPGSPLERHFQLALLGFTLSSPPPNRDVADLLGGLRLWIAEGPPEIAELATVIEQVAAAAFGRPVDRPVADHLRTVVDRARSATSGGGEPERRFRAGLRILAEYPWEPAADDALLWIEMSWGAADTNHSERLRALLDSDRSNEPAALLKVKWARDLMRSPAPGNADRALSVLDGLLDRLDTQRRAGTAIPGTWSSWTRAVVAVDSATPRHTADPLATAIGILLAIRDDDDVRWEHLPKVMSAIAVDDREWVAARMAVHARLLGMSAPAEFDPLKFVGGEVRGAARFLFDLRPLDE